MSFLPRAVIGVAPALFLLVAGALLIQKYRPDAKSDAEVADPGVPLTADDEERMHLAVLKQETAVDVLDGRLTLAHAASRFLHWSTTSPRSIDYLRDHYVGATEEEKAVNQVISYARIHASRNAGRYTEAFARLEAEAGLLGGSLPTAP